MKEDYKVTQLENGLTVASAKLSHSAIVSITVLVKVGSRHESQSLNGISHVLEHMSFKGTKTRSANQIAMDFEDLGSCFNAYTSKEHTVFYVVGLKEHYVKLLELLADIIFESTYDEEELAKEKNVILQEIAQTNDSPDDVIFEKLQKLCYPNHSIGAPIIGNAKNVLSFSRQNIVDFVGDNYTANNMIISVAGNVDHEQINKTVQLAFSRAKKGNSTTFDVPKFVGGVELIERDLDQVHLAMAFNGRGYHDKDYYVSHILSSILGDGLSSRLFLEIREKLGLVYAIQSFVGPAHNAGTMGVFAGTDKDNVTKVLDAIVIELSKIKESIADEEVTRAKNKFKSNLMMSREITSQRGSELATDIAIYGRYIEAQEVVEKIDAVSKERVLALAEEVFVDKFAFSAIGKVKNIIDEDKISKLVV